MTKTIVAALALGLAIAAPAEAATMINAGGTLTYNAGIGDGSGSYLTVSAGSTSATASKLSGSDPFTAVTGCDDTSLASSPGVFWRCLGITAVRLNGGPGRDVLTVESDVVPATVSGGAGEDALSSYGDAIQIIDGGPGDDSLFVSKGDIVRGGTGTNVVSIGLDRPGHPTYSLDGQPNDGLPGEAINLAPDIEDLHAIDPHCIDSDCGLPSSPGATLVGNGGANQLLGSDGDDLITGGGGSDTLTGGRGNDTIDARDGVADRITCGPGTDTVTADQFDQISDTCETVQVAPAAFGLEDTPPAVVWAPGDRTLQISARDDHAVTQVQFLDDGRVLCTDTTAPFTCRYTPRAADIGRSTLIAIATDSSGQTATATRTISVPRLKASALSLTLKRGIAGGKLSLRAGTRCTGTVVVKAGKRTWSTGLRRDCTYRVRIHAERGAKVTATYQGTARVEPRRSKAVRARSSGRMSTSVRAG